MQPFRLDRIASSLAAFLFLLLMVGPGLAAADGHGEMGAPAEGAPEWDPARVSVLANSMRDALATGLKAASEQPPQATAFQQRTRDAALSEMKQVHSQAEDYAKKIADGWSREQSRAWFDLLREGYASARTAAGDAIPGPVVSDQLSLVDAQLEQLARFYDPL
jgi:hypothetical protein